MSIMLCSRAATLLLAAVTGSGETKNLASRCRPLECYKYDGRGIQGTREELIRCMESVSVEAVYQALQQALAA